MNESKTSLQLAGLRIMSRVARPDNANNPRLLDIVVSSNSKCPVLHWDSSAETTKCLANSKI